jgi:hypothetical protein
MKRKVVLKHITQFLTFPAASMPDEALEVWQDATKFYSKSYLAWLTYVNLLMSAFSFFFGSISGT